MTVLPAVPMSKSSSASVDTSGVAIAIPDGSLTPFFPATAAKIWVSAEAYVGIGPDNTPPTAADDNCVVQQATTEEVYTLGLSDSTLDFIYIYAASGTIAYDLSFFG
jgi:hypothetical protein